MLLLREHMKKLRMYIEAFIAWLSFEDIVNVIVLIVVAFVVLMAILSNIGCSTWNYERLEFDDQARLIGKVTASGAECMLDSDIDNVRVIVKDGNKITRSLSIGKIVRDTDAEAVGAVAEGAVTGVGRIVIPVP